MMGQGVALVVVDVQVGFEDPRFGRRDNPACEANVLTLLDRWRAGRRPVVLVQHDSAEPSSPLRPGTPGHALKPGIAGPADLHLHKTVHSAFHGAPALHPWLQARGIERLVICGITTDHCCSTTARVACDLGYTVDFVLDATHTFDRRGADGTVIPAETVARVEAAVLGGEFATLRATAEVLAELG